MNIQDILRVMPHRYPLLLVDRIVEKEPGKRIVGIKNVSFNEPFFQGHFPDHPVMPGVLIIEAMAQTGGILLMDSVDDPAGKLVYFMSIDNARFRKPVTPGDALRIHVSKVRSRGSVWKFAAEARVDGDLVAEATYAAMILDAE